MLLLIVSVKHATHMSNEVFDARMIHAHGRESRNPKTITKRLFLLLRNELFDFPILERVVFWSALVTSPWLTEKVVTNRVGNA